MTTVKDFLARLKRLDEAATDGPWKWPMGGGLYAFNGDDERYIVETMGCSYENGVVIASARNALPVLLKMVQAAREEIQNYPSENHWLLDKFQRILDESEASE